MPKVTLPMGLVVGALVFTTVITPTLFSQPQKVVQAQSTDENNLPTSQETLENILQEIAEDVQINQNQILFKFENQSLLLVTDGEADRMRMLIPVAKVEDVTAENMAKMMIANFHTALDGRYAIGNGVVYAAFIHPLSSLKDRDFRSAVLQVTRLAQTYGETYSSGSSLFGRPVRPVTDEIDLPSI